MAEVFDMFGWFKNKGSEPRVTWSVITLER